MRTFLVGATVYTPDEVIGDGVVVVEDGKIEGVYPAPAYPTGEGERIDVAGLIVAPGLIDLHLHGLEGSDVMSGGVREIARKAPRYGVTSFLATTLTGPLDSLRACVRDIASHRRVGGAEILGIHLEGPFLSPAQPGVMDASQFRSFNLAELEDLLQAGEGAVRMVTLAPEGEGALEGIRQLTRAGVVASVGHSHATYAEMKAAVDAGLRHATHVFNAMRGFHHREPGTVGAVLTCPEIVAQFIADGQHLHPATIDLLLETKGVENLVLISDATPLAGLPPGEYDWKGLMLEVAGGRAQRMSGQGGGAAGGALGGSVRMMNHGLKLLVEDVGLDMAGALTTATTTPARVLGLGDRKGRLAPGWDADIAVFDGRFECHLAMVGGEVVYRATRT